MTVNTGKLVLAALGLICVTLLMLTAHVQEAVGVPIITLVVGYAVGNGNSARNGATAEPIIKPRRDEQTQT